MKRFLPKLLVLLLASAPAVAQTVSGRVTNGADGTGLPGVSVLIKGTTNGTTTDNDGRYSISTSDTSSPVLVFSFIGFTSQEIEVGNQTSINVILAEDITQLGEVVVTALGIEKNVKALGYSVTEVDGSKFTESREMNLGNALTGQIAGVNVSGLGTGPTGSSRVTIRGNSSLKGNNQPLYVIDGIPFDNSSPFSLSSDPSQGYAGKMGWR